MKKKLLVGLAALIITTIAGLSSFAQAVFETQKDEQVTETPLTKCTISSIPKDNEGICKAKINGTGDACVKPGFWETKNCDG